MGRNICICFPVIGRIDVCCHIAVVSEGNKNTQHIHWVQCPAAGNAGVYRLPRLWEQVADPFPWSLSCLALRVQPSGGEMESVCPQLAQHVFPNVSVPLFSSPVQSCSRWGDKHGAQPQAVQEIFQYFVQKTCFDRLCHIWRDIYSASHSFLRPHDTILLTGSICALCKSKTYFWQMKLKKKEVVFSNCEWNTLERGNLAQPKVQIGAIFSRAVQKQKTLWPL